MPTSSRLAACSLGLLLLARVAAAGETLDLATTSADAAIVARGMSIAGSFGDRLSAAAVPADVSGDGQPDLIASAFMADGPPGSPRPDAGEVHVLFGPLALGVTRDLRVSPADVTIFGARDRDSLHAQGASDLDGDGRPDLLLVATRDDGLAASRPDAGRVLVACGPFASGTVLDLATTSADIQVLGAMADDQLDARDPADFDGDGHLDLLLIVTRGDGPGGRVDAGEALVLRGPFARGTTIDLATATPASRIVGADALDNMTWAQAADFNADGVVDVALATYRSAGFGNSNPGAGEVHVVFGPLPPFHDLAVDPGFVVFGDVDLDSLGSTVSAGDLDGDGHADLVIGACCTDADGGARDQSGSVHVFFSPLPVDSRFASEADVIVHGRNAHDSMRFAVTGRANADACDDLVVGADFAAGAGGLRPEGGEIAVLGGPFSRGQRFDLALDVADLAIFGAEGAGIGDFGDLLGIATMGDLTGDGQPDLVASAQFADGPGNARRDSGEIYLVEGGCAHLPSAMPLISPSLETLHCVWPPNHGVACFGRSELQPAIETTCGVGGSWRLAGCASAEAAGFHGDGGHDDEPDCFVAADGSAVCVRAERAGGGSGSQEGRRYLISAVPVDACGREGAPVPIGTIHVPHDQSPKGACRAPTIPAR